MLLLFYASISALASTPSQFFWLSDLHFNPLADPALADKLAGAEPAQWASILAASSSGFSGFGQDANWPLVSSAIAKMREVQPNPAFTMLTGDLLPHHFREQFDRSVSNHDDVAFRQFVRKSIEFIGLQLKQIAPHAPLVISLGNNDAECGDYQLQPHGPFLNDTRAVVSDLAGTAGDSSFTGTWTTSGSYSMPNPVLRRYRLIVLNTVLFSTRYRDRCGNTSDDPGRDLLAWLRSTLAGARKHHEKVWLVYHLPPGIDAYASSHQGTPVPFWKPAYSKEFEDLCSTYSGVIRASFAGHIHVDDFRLLGSSASHGELVMIAPALSPNIRQNPAFRVVTLEADGHIADQATYYLTNLPTAGNEVKADWKLEYSFNRAWNLHGLDFANYQKLYRRIDSSPETRDRWMLFLSASRPEAGNVTPANFRAFYCATGHTNPADYQACLSARPAAAQIPMHPTQSPPNPPSSASTPTHSAASSNPPPN